MKTIFKTNTTKITLFFLITFSILSCTPEDGKNGIDGINGKDGINGINGTNGTNGTSTYYNPIVLSGNLNNSNNAVTTAWAILNIGVARTFNKVAANTHVDIKFRSNVLSGIFSQNPAAIEYQLFVNGVPGAASSKFITFSSNTSEFVILDSIFTNLPIGTNTITIRAKMNTGTSTGVIVDPGSFGGQIIVQER